MWSLPVSTSQSTESVHDNWPAELLETLPNFQVRFDVARVLRETEGPRPNALI